MPEESQGLDGSSGTDATAVLERESEVDKERQRMIAEKVAAAQQFINGSEKGRRTISLNEADRYRLERTVGLDQIPAIDEDVTNAVYEALGLKRELPEPGMRPTDEEFEELPLTDMGLQRQEIGQHKALLQNRLLINKLPTNTDGIVLRVTSLDPTIKSDGTGERITSSPSDPTPFMRRERFLSSLQAVSVHELVRTGTDQE